MEHHWEELEVQVEQEGLLVAEVLGELVVQGEVVVELELCLCIVVVVVMEFVAAAHIFVAAHRSAAAVHIYHAVAAAAVHISDVVEAQISVHISAAVASVHISAAAVGAVVSAHKSDVAVDHISVVDWLHCNHCCWVAVVPHYTEQGLGRR